MDYKQYLVALVIVVICFYAGTLNVMHSCAMLGKYNMLGTTIICTVKDDNMLGTNLSWNKE